MADADARRPEEIRREIETEREGLARAVDDLRAGIGDAADIKSKVRAKLPLVAGGAAGAGFVLAGGIGAVMRLLARRGREGDPLARVGRFTIVDRS